MQVPFVDLKLQFQLLREEIIPVVTGVMEQAAFIGGRELQELEKRFAEFCHTGCGIATSSGTTALHLALLGVGVERGDEVITVPNTFIATAEAISHCGAEPVFVEAREDSYNMDPEALRGFISGCSRNDGGYPVNPETGRRVSAIVPVHLFGQTADMDGIREALDGTPVSVVEDCAQAHGAEYKGRRAGSLGDAAAFSFFPGKNLGAYGDGGMVLTGDAELGLKIKMLSNHGRTKKYEHAMRGYNYRMDNLQAAIVLVKLNHLEDWTEKRRAHARTYAALFQEADLDAGRGGPVTLPVECEGYRHVYHLFVIRVEDRDALQAYLKDKGIATGIHYPIPLHLQPAFQHIGGKPGQFPVSERVAGGMLSLPMYPELTEEQIGYVVGAVRDHYRGT
jgi:dTDP-4-amino-4,6-dideoxygalactose transaminase